jgi:hypothetical protein
VSVVEQHGGAARADRVRQRVECRARNCLEV